MGRRLSFECRISHNSQSFGGGLVAYGFRVEVWGDYALFTRPEMKSERVSYDIITPSAARGLLESIYWHPGLKWVIDKIYMMNPIKHTNLRRNEVKSKASAQKMLTAINKQKDLPYLVTSSDIMQRASLLLKDVHYVVEAHFEMTKRANASDNEGKFADIFRRRLEKGQAYSQPYFGCRECTAHFRPYEGKMPVPTAETGEHDLGFMLYDMDYSDKDNIHPQFFHAVLRDGVLDLREVNLYR